MNQNETYPLYNKRNMNLVLAVVGSRNLKFCKNRVFLEIKEIRKIHNIIEIVSGDCKTGIDAFAKEYAQDNKIKYTGFAADWQDFAEPCLKKKNDYGFYNALAGINRNTTIADYCNGGIVFWDGKSPGTRDIGNKIYLQNKLMKKIIIPT